MADRSEHHQRTDHRAPKPLFHRVRSEVVVSHRRRPSRMKPGPNPNGKTTEYGERILIQTPPRLCDNKAERKKRENHSGGDSHVTLTHPHLV